MAGKSIQVFIDSDVIISSLLSTSGAAYTLLHDTKGIKLYLSNFSSLELERVVNRLQLNPKKLQKTINTRFTTVKINQSYEKIQEQFIHYVRDVDDAHIVAGAKIAKVTFLISYNIRHFESEKLRQDFKIILLTPGWFLQYLRSL